MVRQASELTSVVPLASARTLADAAANELREAILLGQLKPGTKLSQESLARQLQVSRVPLREALQLLTAEGLVEWRAHRTAVVTGLTAADFAELYELGATAEAAAVAQAVLRATDSHIAAIGDLLASMAHADVTPTTWHAINRRFHAMLIEPAGWPRFQRIISEVRANTGRYVKAYLAMSGNIHRWREEHDEIFEAYRSRNSVAASQAIERHWRHTSQTLQMHLQAMEASTGELDARAPAGARGA